MWVNERGAIKYVNERIIPLETFTLIEYIIEIENTESKCYFSVFIVIEAVLFGTESLYNESCENLELCGIVIIEFTHIK